MTYLTSTQYSYSSNDIFHLKTVSHSTYDISRLWSLVFHWWQTSSHTINCVLLKIYLISVNSLIFFWCISQHYHLYTIDNISQHDHSYSTDIYQQNYLCSTDDISQHNHSCSIDCTSQHIHSWSIDGISKHDFYCSIEDISQTKSLLFYWWHI